ncbi:MAG: hypothetical protein AB1599_02740 [Planctomycetota bacterium]
MRSIIRLFGMCLLLLLAMNTGRICLPTANGLDNPIGFTFLDKDVEIKRLKEALDEKDLATKLWAIRRLGKHPQSVSGPILLEQFNKPMSEDTLTLRCAIIYCFSQMEYQEAIPQLLQVIKMDLSKYGWTPPELFRDELKELREHGNVKKEKDGSSPIPDSTAPTLKERLVNTRKKMLESYNQKLNWGLLHLRTMQFLGKFKVKESSEDIYRLVTAKETPVAYLAVDTLKLINDQKIIELLTKDSIIYWQPHLRERVIYTMTELATPYRKADECKGTEWLKKSLFRLVAEEVNRPGQSNDCLIKALNIMDMLGEPNCRIYDFASENNLMKEFTGLTNLLKANDPEIMFYDHDLLIKFIKDEMLMKAMYSIFSDVLKPLPMLITTTPSAAPESAPKPEMKPETPAPAQEEKPK